MFAMLAMHRQMNSSSRYSLPESAGCPEMLADQRRDNLALKMREIGRAAVLYGRRTGFGSGTGIPKGIKGSRGIPRGIPKRVAAGGRL